MNGLDERDDNEDGLNPKHILGNLSDLIGLHKHVQKDIARELVRKDQALAELHEALSVYHEFFMRHEQEVKQMMNLVVPYDNIKYLYSHYNSIDTYTSFLEHSKNVLEELASIYSFLTTSNRQHEMDQLGEEMNAKDMRPDLKLSRLERDINNMRERFPDLLNSIINFINSLSQFESILGSLAKSIQKSFAEQVDNGFFGTIKTGNVNYKHNGNLLLTAFYNDIFKALPTIEKKDTQKFTYKKTLNNVTIDLALLKSTGIYKEIVDGKLLITSSYELFKSLMYFFKELIPVHKQVEYHIQEILSKRDPQLVGQKFKDKRSFEKKFKQLEEAFGPKMTKIFNILEDLYYGKILQDMELPKDKVGLPKLLGLKKNIFDKFDAYFTQDLGADQVEKLLISASKTKQEFEKYKKETNLEEDKGGKLTNHYRFTIGSLGLIEGYTAHPATKPAKVIGKTAELIKDKVSRIIKHNEGFGHIFHSYPGIDNSLEGNVLIFGPYGYGKTALIRELAVQKDIVTLQVKYDDISTAYYGHEDKNASAIFEYAQQLGEEKNKHVFVLIDEIDRFFSSGKSMLGNNRNLGVQTGFQIGMDGIEAFDKVHIVGLSNKPDQIPMDIVRRMEVIVMDPLSLQEKVELIHSRLNRFPKEPDLEHFLAKLQSTHHHDLCMNGESELLANLKEATPKIVAAISEKSFQKFHDRLLKTDPQMLRTINKRIGTLNRKKKTEEKEYVEVYKKASIELTKEDFAASIQEVFANVATRREIDVNNKFYDVVEKLIANMQGTSYIT